MSQTVTGTASAFDPTVAFTEKAPADGDGLNAASVTDNTTTPKTGFQAEANALEWLRQNAMSTSRDALAAATWTLQYARNAGALGLIRIYVGNGKQCDTINAFWSEGTAKWASDANASLSSRTILYADGSWGKEYKAPTAATWNDGVGAGAWTAGVGIDTAGFINAQAGASFQTGNVLVVAGSLTAGTTLAAQTARSSATTGAGQSVAAGVIYKDSSAFAYARIKHTAANTNTVTRSLNLASDPTEAVTGKFVFALQTAAPNGLIVIASVAHAGGSYFASVQPSTITTSAFQVWVYDLTPALVDISVNDELHVAVFAY